MGSSESGVREYDFGNAAQGKYAQCYQGNFREIQGEGLLIKNLARMTQHLSNQWGENLVSVVLYGSYARGESSPQSDVDMVIISRGFSRSRYERRIHFRRLLREWAGKDEGLREFIGKLSAILMTPEEADTVKPYYLGILEGHRVFYDREGFFQHRLERLRRRMKELGTRKAYTRNGEEYWILKEPYTFGETIEL